MATSNSASLTSPAASRDGQSSVYSDIREFWSLFFARAFNPYRPELYYMRGPGPACRAKQTASSAR